jgi:hypothetical protein
MKLIKLLLFSFIFPLIISGQSINRIYPDGGRDTIAAPFIGSVYRISNDVVYESGGFITLPSTFCLGDSILLTTNTTGDSLQWYAYDPSDTTQLSGTFNAENEATTYYTPEVGEDNILFKVVTYDCLLTICSDWLLFNDEGKLNDRGILTLESINL